jgi:branched-chain amino acid transport system permease protein
MATTHKDLWHTYWPHVLGVVVLILPLVADNFAIMLTPIMVFALVGLGLNIVAGYTGLLNLGTAAFMAIGAYTFAICTVPIYPFQLGFWAGLGAAIIVGAVAGTLLALPAMRLRGDYLAIVTLGFGEIITDVLKNLSAITKGTQGLNPVAAPTLPGISFTISDYQPWYYLYFALLLLAMWLCHNLRYSRLGRQWIAVRDDELAAQAMGISPARTKLIAFACGSGLCAAGGALFASLNGTSIEPSFYDFQQSVVILCIVLVGGMGSMYGVLLGALIMVGFNSIILVKLTDWVMRNGWAGDNVLATPSNWKFMIFGLALIIMMRLRPQGLLSVKTGNGQASGSRPIPTGSPS